MNIDWTDDGVVDLYIAWFAGRTDLYVQNGAAVVRQPLTRDVIRRARAHHYAISAYTAIEGRTHVGAIDFDREDGKQLAMEVAALLANHKVRALVLDSRRGAHVWVTCEEQIEAGQMHRALAEALALTGDGLANDEKVEVFPKYGEELAVGALRLPMMPHQKTQVMYPGYGDGQPLASLEEVLGWYDLTEAKPLRLLAGLGKAPNVYPKALDGFYGYTAPRGWREAPSASQVLQTLGVHNAAPGRTVRCPRHNDKHGSLTVFRDDERVYCGAPGCDLHNEGHGVGSVVLQRMVRSW